jgi:hypothetical protein
MAGGNRPDVASYPVISGYYMSSITMVGAGPAPHRPTSGIGALIHYDWARAIFFGFKRDKITTPKPGELRIFHSTSQSGKQPEATVTVPSDYKVLSGGARVNYSGQGNFLTASFPKDVRTWVARAKQQKVDDIATIDIWAIAIFDPLDDWEVRISQSTGPRSALASTATASVDGYVLTGGGAESHWQSSGALLTESYPNPQKAGYWVASTKSHLASDSITITAYAIGIKALGRVVGPTAEIYSNTSAIDSRPSTGVATALGYTLFGGGAKVNYSGEGNLLTASYPDFDNNTWKVASKEHIAQDPCTITAYAIGLKSTWAHRLMLAGK